ncbi:hypothetical protein RND81_11G150400 [Saponaria officinalis]|uniref:S-protein homolog n=1 Tax=Saponaria officinalis TaxID=3572 RepID=A0AAW1HM94_SAPOF
MAPNHMVVILLCVILVHTMFDSTLAQYQFKKYTIRIINKIGTSPKVSLRCQSKDDDLGTHVLGYGEEFNWTFRVNFMMSTLYFCHFQWKDKDITFDVFEVYLGSTMCDREYIWEVKEDAFYQGCEGEIPKEAYYGGWNKSAD